MTRTSVIGGAALDAYAVLDDAARRAPEIAIQVPGGVRKLAARANIEITSGIPRYTWNGMLGEQLAPGLHPVTAGEAQLRFAWNDQRAHMYGRMLDSLTAIRRDHPEVRWVGGGGSFFGSTKPHPGDIDLALLDMTSSRAAIGREEFAMLNRRDAITHVYPGQEWSAGIPRHNFLEFFGHDRSGARRGMVLLDLDELGIPAGRLAQAVA